MSTDRAAELSSDWRRHLPTGRTATAIDLAAGGTLPAVWLNCWATNPQRTVVFDSHDGWATGAQLSERSQHLARRLAGAGIVPGDRVLMSGPSSARLVAAHAALLGMGAVVVPLNGAFRADEVRGVVTDCRPAAALVEGVGNPGEWKQWIASADPAVLVGDFDATDLDSGAADAALDLHAQARLRQPADPALIGYTSGTTGRPKGAVLSHANLLASVRALELAWRWTPDDVLVLALPLFHMHGLGVGLHGTLTVGARAVLQPSFEPDAVFDAIAEHHATLFFGVPTMYSRLVNSPRAAELSALRLCVSGSAPMPAELHDTVRQASGQRVIERYGMTETVMLVSNPYDESRRAGTVGFPLPGVEVWLDAVSTGDQAAVDETAEILVRGSNVFSGYWERPEANAESFTDGWFRTGDLGQWDDGYLRIVGRAKELIICGGFNVYPREVEEVIASHSDVIECAVAGEPDPEWGEVVVAYVVAEREFDDDELKDFVGERLAHYKRPRRTHRIAALPRNALGKVQRHELAAVAGTSARGSPACGESDTLVCGMFQLHEVQRASPLPARFVAPGSLSEAVGLLSSHGAAARLIAGGTDLMLELSRGARSGVELLIDISRLPDLDQITYDGGAVTLGPLVTHADVIESAPMLAAGLPLAQACLEVGSPPLRNRATVVGNIVTASPANDTISALVALGADVTMASVRGERTVPIDDFFAGFRQTVLEPDEMVTSVAFDALDAPRADGIADRRGIFVKLGLRRAQAISVVHAAVVAHLAADGTAADLVVALGSVAATIVTVPDAADAARGRGLAEASADIVEAAKRTATPIDDIRGSAEYRLHSVGVVVERAIAALADGSQAERWPVRPPRLVVTAHGEQAPPPVRAAISEPDDVIAATVNGAARSAAGASGKTLMDWLRDDLGLTGTKEGCAEGECGACTVHLDGAAVFSCLVPAGRAAGANITTVEGIASPVGGLHPFQQAMVDTGGAQCGFCTPGFVVSAAALLDEVDEPTPEQIQIGLSGNLCRCTGYCSIIEAVAAAAAAASANEARQEAR